LRGVGVSKVGRIFPITGGADGTDGFHPEHHADFVPWDETLRLSAEALTPAAHEVVCVLAARLPD
jgi:hypothetical protein